jgi:CspA family cold shock protein
MNEELAPIWPGCWRLDPLSRPEQLLIMVAHGALARSNRRSFGKFVEEKRCHRTVTWFNDANGFGFVMPDEGGDDLFAHFSEICHEGFTSLADGQKVIFEAKMGQWQAGVEYSTGVTRQATAVREDRRAKPRDHARPDRRFIPVKSLTPLVL